MARLERRLKKRAKTPVYNIGITSKLTGIPVYTIRWIERHDLIEPQRTEGNQRLFSDSDIEILNRIRELMEEGVNVPGIRVILRMRIEHYSISTGFPEDPKTEE